MPTTQAYYRVKQNFGVQYKGEMITLQAGEDVPANHPLLKQLGKTAVAEHFVEGTDALRFGRWDVEQATAAPGAKRGA